MIERDMEDLIAKYPSDFFPRHQLTLKGRQESFAGIGRFDLLFEDEFQSAILMELKARTAKYEDATQVARYRDELKRQGHKNVIMWVVAIQVPPSVKEFLADKGIEYTEIHLSEFRRVAEKHNHSIQSEAEQDALVIPPSAPKSRCSTTASQRSSGEHASRTLIESRDRFQGDEFLIVALEGDRVRPLFGESARL
jgi:Endonuclease NucS